MRIAVDAAGGDHAPGAPVQAALAVAERGECEVVVVGPAERIEPMLGRRAGSIEVVDAPEVISAEESPALAVRRKPRSSIAVGIRLVREGRVDGFVSAGDTGALMVAGKWILDTIPGIERPALAAVLPTRDGRGLVLLDVGAQVDCSAAELLSFAVMGAVFAEHVLGRTPPRVGLLNIGTEARKGNRVTREAYDLFSRGPFDFAGNVEPRDLLEGGVDVVVADGFAGNLVLKTIEGTALSLFRLMRSELRASLRSSLGALIARPALERVRARLDYREHGGAPLLGLGGVVIKCHGSSNAVAIANGIRVARGMVAGRVLERIGAAAEKGDGVVG